MSGEFAAAGDIATGALLGRAVEPGAGEGGGDAHGGGVCLNCGTALIGDFCHACGQNGHVHKTLMSIGHDLLHGVFHFEGKVWRTVPMLVLHPGKLTRRYIDGERARFVSPLALFLFFVFLMFASIHAVGAGDFGEGLSDGLRGKQAEAVRNLDDEIKTEEGKLKALESSKLPAKSTGDDTVESLREDIQNLKVARDKINVGTNGRPVGNVSTGFGKTWPRLNHAIEKVNANPELAIYKLQSAAYKYSWVLIPISVPFVALLFLWRRRFKMYDHAIFVTYSLAFMLLLVTVFSVLLTINAPGWIAGCLLAFGPPVHLFVQLRGTYALKWFSALWRTIALMMFGSITITLFALLLLALGIME